MIALVCEKNKFESKNGDVYFSVILASYNTFAKDYRIINAKDKDGKYIPRRYFLPKDVFDSVSFGHVYDFGFTSDEYGNGRISSATSSKFSN